MWRVKITAYFLVSCMLLFSWCLSNCAMLCYIRKLCRTGTNFVGIHLSPDLQPFGGTAHMELTRGWLCVGLSIILWAKSCRGKPLYFVPWLLPYCPEQAPMGARSSSVSGYTENLLKWFNYPYARAHPRCEVSCHGTEWTCIVGSSMIHRGQPDSGESCIALQSGTTRSLVAKFPQHSVVTCSMRISCCRGRMLTTPLLALHPCRYAQNQLQTDKTLVECLISVYSSMPLTHWYVFHINQRSPYRVARYW